MSRPRPAIAASIPELMVVCLGLSWFSPPTAAAADDVPAPAYPAAPGTPTPALSPPAPLPAPPGSPPASIAPGAASAPAPAAAAPPGAVRQRVDGTSGWEQRQTRPPERILQTEPHHEYGLGVGQIAAGVGTGFVITALIAVVGSETDSSGAVGALVLADPAAVGMVVCGIGGTSDYYEGSCGPVVAGAYLGALTAIPLAFLGCQLDGSNSSDFGCIGGAAIGIVLGYFIGTAVGATVAWHSFKEPRVHPTYGGASLVPGGSRAPRAPVPPTPLADLDRRSLGHAPARFQLSVPVLSLEF